MGEGLGERRLETSDPGSATDASVMESQKYSALYMGRAVVSSGYSKHLIPWVVKEVVKQARYDQKTCGPPRWRWRYRRLDGPVAAAGCQKHTCTDSTAPGCGAGSLPAGQQLRPFKPFEPDKSAMKVASAEPTGPGPGRAGCASPARVDQRLPRDRVAAAANQGAGRRLLRGEVGTVPVSGPEYEQSRSRVAALVPRGAGPGRLDMAARFTEAERRVMSPAVRYALLAAQEAERTGVVVGVNMTDTLEILATSEQYQAAGASGIGRHFIPRISLNIAAGQLSMRYNCRGPVHTCSNACATGSHAVGDAFRFIRDGYADAMLAGATDANVFPMAMAGFSRLGALSTSYNGQPARASRPFDAARDGFVLGEGAAVLVLESLEHARARGASIVAEVLGFGLCSDAFHATAPRPDGDGARRAMALVLRDAGVPRDEVTHVNAHATATPIGDGIEARVLRDSMPHAPAVSAIKGALGHMMAASGAVEAAITALSCLHGRVPPIANLTRPDVDGVDYVREEARVWRVDGGRRVALSNSFGFGCVNAALCMAEFVD
ncbi:3-oxoacyl-[acyl-carrier-protein] synthase, mitochondrial-like [Pollicipes pollicipes]|uniref:3-oxoacyl-[acyl-carrier-protein] synthase, mitochondrial-like n=1 Tax=Pollicipes pollicipes TaxID=41117 RepID=UPI0018849176|nr:3-oxoacyl-[acyl-carrier-protein] synthase, mitochondrial-like [Pollicipes pollicipes]